MNFGSQTVNTSLTIIAVELNILRSGGRVGFGFWVRVLGVPFLIIKILYLHFTCFCFATIAFYRSKLHKSSLKQVIFVTNRIRARSIIHNTRFFFQFSIQFCI